MFLLSIPAGWQTCGITMFASLLTRLIFLMCQPVEVTIDDDDSDGVSLLFAVSHYVHDVVIQSISFVWGIISLFYY